MDVSLKNGARRSDRAPVVAVLLCTYQGAAFLEQQLDSIESQTYSAWVVWASDDGSTDDTLKILQRYRTRWGGNRMVVVSGPRTGSARNFLTLTCRSEIDADYFAWADQDDIWLPHKLARALAALATYESTRPALYGTRTILTNSHDQVIGLSARFERSPCFRNALVQSVAGGNTITFNRSARDLLIRAGANLNVIAHDWWAYQLISGCGGAVLYDSQPSVRYRQHGRNQIGSNVHPLARMLRLQILMRGEFKCWIDRNLAALELVRPLLTAENCEVLENFIRWRDAPLGGRIAGMWRSPIRWQTRSGDLALRIAALLKRL
jgi:glycosyltransferase involved in cell wall biosynthesis